jgi:hypothetical protein
VARQDRDGCASREQQGLSTNHSDILLSRGQPAVERRENPRDDSRLSLNAGGHTIPLSIVDFPVMRDEIGGLDPRRLHGIGSRYPEWPVVLAAAAAWGFLALRPHGHAGHHHGPAQGGATDFAGLAAMVVAMMLPLMIASIREAALSAPRPRRAMAKFLAGYLGVWMLAMPLIDVAWRQLLAGGISMAVGTMLVAALWELTPAKERRPRGCGAGSRLGAGLFRSGMMAGGACVGSCWALMAVCVAFAHDVRVMAALFCVQLVARYRPSLPPALAALAVLVVCLASLALRLSGSHAA